MKNRTETWNRFAIEVNEYTNKQKEVVGIDTHPVLADIRNIKNKVFSSLSMAEYNEYDKLETRDKDDYLINKALWQLQN